MIRKAIITGKTEDDIETIKAYLPANYEFEKVVDEGIIISGEDNCGWTMDEYVLPRLASGLHFGKEITKEN